MVGDTTFDHYHNFADPSKQEMRYRALSQNRRFFCEPVPRLTGEGVYPAQAPKQRNMLELEVAVKAGSTLDLSCLRGMNGMLSILTP